MIMNSPLSIGGHPFGNNSLGTPRQHRGASVSSPTPHHNPAIRTNEILAENSNLKAKVNVLSEELTQARTIYEREQRKWQRQAESLKELLKRKEKHTSGGTMGPSAGSAVPPYASVLESVSPARPHFNRSRSHRGPSVRSPVSDPDRLLYNGAARNNNNMHASPTSGRQFPDIMIVSEEGDSGAEEEAAAAASASRNPFASIMSLGTSHPLGTKLTSPDRGGVGLMSVGEASANRRNKLLDDLGIGNKGDDRGSSSHSGSGSPKLPPPNPAFEFPVSSGSGGGRRERSFTTTNVPPSPQFSTPQQRRAPSTEASVQADKPRGKNVIVQTNPSAEDDLVSDLRHLNAELLKTQAQNAMLSGSVDMLKRDVADAASEKIVKRYEEMTMSHIRQLSRALENANAAIHIRDKAISDLKREALVAAEAKPAPATPAGKGTPLGGSTTSYASGRPRGASTALSPSQKIIAAAQERIKSAAIGEGPDPAGSPNRARHADGSLVALPPGVPADVYKTVSDPGASDVVAALQAALDVTRAQLKCALQELASKKSSELTYGRLAPTIHTRTLDVGTQVAQESDIARVFTLYHQDFTQANVERLLSDNEGRKVRALMALDASGHGVVPMSDSNGSPSSDAALQQSLRAARSELLSAHAHIEELEFALELERREKQRALDHVSGTEGGVTVGEASRQAAHEIAFLCDTLNATRIENEQLHEQLLVSENERQIAIQSLTAVRQRTEDVINGCQNMADASKQETESAVISLLGQLHQKTSELSSARNTLTATKRQNAALIASNESLEREVRDQKRSIAGMRDAAAKLRDEFNGVTVALRGAKKEIITLKAAAAATPQSNGGGTARQRSGTRTQAALPAVTTPAVHLSAPLQDRAMSPSSSQPQHHDPNSISTDLERLAALGDYADPAAASDSPNRLASSGGGLSKTSNAASGVSPYPVAPYHVDPSAADLFRDLARYTPGAESPLQIVDGVRGHISHLSETVADLRREIKVKNDRVAALERQVAASYNASRRPGGGGAATVGGFGSSTARSVGAVSASPRHLQRLAVERHELEQEVLMLRERCEAAERELMEGRGLMMDLISKEE